MKTAYVKIVMYDPKTTEPPYEMLTLHEVFTFEEPADDEGGRKRYDILTKLCSDRGHVFKSYCGCGTEEDPYKACVYGGGYTLEDRAEYERENPLARITRELCGVL